MSGDATIGQTADAANALGLEAHVVLMPKMRFCKECGGKGMVQTPCPDGHPGCAVWHGRKCPSCDGTGKVGGSHG